MAPDTQGSFSNKILCAYTASPYIYRYCGAQVCMTTNLMYLMTAYNMPNDEFTVKDTSFYKSKVG